MKHRQPMKGTPLSEWNTVRRTDLKGSLPLPTSDDWGSKWIAQIFPGEEDA